MAYDEQVLRRATARLREQKTRREADREKLRRSLYTQCPELADIDR